MQYKTLLLASFVDKKDVTDFLYGLDVNHDVKSDKVFIYELNEKTNLLTYKIKLDIGIHFNIRRELPKTIQIHKKKLTFFTINALNKLIERDSGLERGNVNHKEYNVDWDKYENKLILLRGDNLEISDINRIFS